jgi:hypothetical protein
VAKSGAKAMPPMIYVPPIDGQRRSSSMREKAGRNLPTSPLAAGILRQQSVATPTGNFVHRTVIPHVTSSVAGACLMDPSADGMACESFEAAGIRHVGAKCKPRLTRQIAVQDDLAGNNLQCPPSSGYNKCVSFNTANIMMLPSSKEDHLQRQQHYCPLHSPRSLQGVWESSIEEDYEDVAEEPKRNRSAIDKDKIFSAVASIYTNRDKNRLGLSGFIPRKLSTISSRSCSINPDNEAGTDETFEIIDESQPSSGQAAAATALLTPAVKSSQVDPAAFRAFKSSNELLNVYATKRHKSNKEAELSKSDHDLYQPKMSHPPSKSSQRKSIGSSSIVRLIVTPENSSSSASSSSARVVEETRFGADDMVLVHPRPDAVQSPDSGSVLNQKELDDDDDSSQHEQEMDPLMQ